MNIIKITSTNISEKVTCPTSKSYAARALIYASLKNEPVTLINLPKAQDTLDLMSCLKRVGLKFSSSKENEITITNHFPACELTEREVELELGEGGTTSRFLIPLLALGKCNYKLLLSQQMKARPMQELYTSLRELGVSVLEKELIILQGPIKSLTQTLIDCEKSSQFASGFKLIQDFSQFEMKLVNLSLSKKYFDLTNYVISEMRQKKRYIIPADFSSAGYFIAYALFSETSLIENIQALDHHQADSILVEILNDAGANITISELGLLVSGNSASELIGLKVDGDKCIDLIPTLFFIAAHIAAKSTFTNVSGLIHKESDRLSEMLKILDVFNVEYIYDSGKDEVVIMGKMVDSYCRLSEDFFITPAADHRMLMIATLFTKLRGGGRVGNAHAVAKSFPDFFSFFY